MSELNESNVIGSESDTPENSTGSSRRQRLAKNKKINVVQKELLIKMFEEGEPLKKAASMANINLNTAKSILTTYRRNDCEIVEKPRGGKRHGKLNDDVLEKIEKMIEDNAGITIREMKIKLGRDNINISKSTIANGLIKLKITLKKASLELDRMNSSTTIALRMEYATRFSVLMNENAETIFIDECGFNLHLRRTQARSKVNTRAPIVVPTVRGRYTTLIAAINKSKIIHYKIISSSSTNSAKFCEFLDELIAKITLENPDSEAKLIMDNAKIHKTEMVRNIIAATNFDLMYLPPYSPMLNPIENSFSKIKLYARQKLNDIENEHQNLVQIITESVSTITEQDCFNYNLNMCLKIPDAIAGRPLH